MSESTIRFIKKSNLPEEDKERLLRVLTSRSVEPARSAPQDIDPALRQANKRLGEIREEQRSLNRQKNALSKETKALLKQYPTLRWDR